MTRPAFGGNTIATIACPDFRPQMATVRPGVMQKRAKVAGAKANVIEFNPGFTPDNKYVEILFLSLPASSIFLSLSVCVDIELLQHLSEFVIAPQIVQRPPHQLNIGFFYPLHVLRIYIDNEAMRFTCVDRR